MSVKLGFYWCMVEVEPEVKSSAKKLPKAAKYAIRALPLAGAIVTGLFNITRFEQQFLVLIVLLWLQVYFIFELFLAGR